MYKKLILLALSAGTFAAAARADEPPVELETVIVTAPIPKKKPPKS